MLHIRMVDFPKTTPGALRLTLACALLFVWAAAPLHAQYTYQEVGDFNCDIAGCSPIDFGQLVEWSDTNLYGTTSGGPDNSGWGSIFTLPLGVTTPTDVWPFTNVWPQAGLTLGPDGNFYGATSQASGYGFAFRYSLDKSTFTDLHDFNASDGGGASTPPVQGRDGNFYGVSDSGLTYRVSYPSGVYKSLAGTTPGALAGPLVAGLDGNLYGVTRGGGTSGDGAIFRMTTAGAISVLYSFSGGADGGGPNGLVQAADGNFYGTTNLGGRNNTGGIFQFTLSPRKLNPLYSFTALNPSTGQNSDGANPAAGLVVASDGYLYGTTDLGGVNTCGTLFRIATTGMMFSKLAEFPYSYCFSLGTIWPSSVLLQHTNGCFYGTTLFGGSFLQGTVYALCPIIQISTVKVEGPVWVMPGTPVTLVGDNLEGVIQVTFAGAQAQFSPGSNTYLIAQVPNAAIDGEITVTLASGLPVQSQAAVHILPAITNLDPASGSVGTQVGIVGGGFAAATKVTFGGVKATSFTVAAPNLIQAIVPAGAKTGKVAVTTPNGTSTSKEKFTVN